jgi:hypothetical protein
MRMFCLTILCGAMLTALPSAARAQAPILGQPYQVPLELSSYGAGTLINYGGFNYVIQGDGTMLPFHDSGFTYSSFYGPPAATYFLIQQPVYSAWGAVNWPPAVVGTGTAGTGLTAVLRVAGTFAGADPC